MLLKEVLACYEALSRGEEPVWKPAPPFRDYIAWLQQQEQKDSEAERFWRALLKDFTRPTPLGVAGASRKPREQKGNRGKAQIQLSRDETARLQAFVREHRLTLNTLAQAAWALLLSRYSGESDVLFGSVTAVRPPTIPGVESMVGPLINTLPVRLRIVPRESILTLLKKLHRQHVEMSQYAYSPLLKVQEWSGVPRGTPLFDSLLVFQNFPKHSTQGEDGSLAVRPDRSFGRTNFPLAIEVQPGPTMSLVIDFDAARFDTPAITRMLGDFQDLLRDMDADHGRRLGDLWPLTDKKVNKPLADEVFEQARDV